MTYGGEGGDTTFDVRLQLSDTEDVTSENPAEYLEYFRHWKNIIRLPLLQRIH